MKDLSLRTLPTLDTLPAASAELAGALVMLSGSNKPYFCDGTQWLCMVDTAAATRSERPRAVCDIGGINLSGKSFGAGTKFLPQAQRNNFLLNGFRIQVFTAAATSVSFGVYANIKSGSNDGPGVKLAATADVSVSTTGIKDVALTTPLQLYAGELYWVAMVMPLAVGIYGLAVTNIDHVIGRAPGSYTPCTHLFLNSTTALLDSYEGATFSMGADYIPAIFML